MQTDATGAFAFQGLPAGRYVLTAERTGYIAAKFGAPRSTAEGTPVAVGPNVTTPTLNIVLSRGGVLTGTVTDASGTARARVRVRFAPVRRESGRLTIITADDAPSPPVVMTDDRGAYRVSAVPPGDYVVFALGGYTPGRAETFAFYPAAASLETAAVITLGAGEERIADIRMPPAPSATVRGVVTMDGQPVANAALAFESTSFSPTRVGMNSGADGRFSMAGVPAARYHVLVRAPSPRRVQGQLVHEVVQTGETDVEVGSTDLEITIPLQTVPILTGRLRKVGPASATPPRIALTPTVPHILKLVEELPLVDGSFRVQDVLPGDYIVSVLGDEKGLGTSHLASVSVGGERLTSPVVHVGVGNRDVAVEVGVTTVTQGLSGVVENLAGATAADLSVVIVPASASEWASGTRRTQTARPATDGSFVFTHIPPGSYRLAVVRDRDPLSLLRDQDAFAELINASVTVTIREGVSVVQQLRIGR